MQENGGSEYRFESNEGINPWLGLALFLGVVIGVVLLVVWGASASPSGGCGGG